jgi:glyoxylase-like metal-dependent hydrolase (beta-lactamase superfamily II)
MYVMIRSALVALAAAIPISDAVAQAAKSTAHAASPPTMLESYQRARSLIDAAVAAHGGLDALRAARRMRIVQQGYEYHPTQGRRISPPFDSTVRRQDVMIDLSAGRIVFDGLRGYPGGFYYSTRYVTNSDKHFNISTRNENYSVQQYPPAEQQFGNLFSIPQWYLLAAAETPSPGARRYLGRIRLGTNGPVVEAVHYPLAPSGNVVIGLDPQTHRLRATLSVGTDVFAGDTEVYTEFLDWRMIDGVLLPSRVVLNRGGHVISALRTVAATPDFTIPDSLLSPPAHFTVAPPNPPANPVQQLADGVWLVGSGSKSLVVAFNDHLVAVDAPSNGSGDVITRAKTFAPGKAIRYVVPTHHHDDHFFGVRHHVANGSTIVTTDGNLDYLRRMMNAPMSTLMQIQNQAPPSSQYKVETMRGDQRVFTDGSRTLEFHRISSPHADDMLIAWLPQEGILFQSDLIEAPQAGVALRGANAEATKHLADVIRAKGWNVKQFVGAHASLQSPTVFQALTQQPVIPPLQQ